MTETATKDFFISYTGRDRSWAEWIAWILEEAGYSVVIQAWDFRPGGNFVLDMQQATQAKRTIAVLSALYLDKPFTQSEWAAAFAQDPTSRDRKLIPVRVEECAPPGLLAQIVYIDIFNCEEAEAKERLLSAIAESRMKPSQKPRFPGKIPEQVPFPGNTSSSSADFPPSSSPGSFSAAPSAIPLSLSTYDESTWVGRDELLSDLTQKLESGCRILTIFGITGIGKTALAERVVVGLQDRGLSFQRLNFDDRGQGRDFLSGVLALLPKLGEVVTTGDQKNAQNALKHLLEALRTKPFVVQIDSLEMLLEGDEQQGWSAFNDALWLDFFQQLLAGQECQSQLILTTQALPEELEIVASRYPRNWHLQSVGGLSEDEQLQLFHKNGLQPDEIGTDYLKRIGKLYDGHPLVLQVIAKDILGRPFNGNVVQYWRRYQGEFDEAESDSRSRGSSPKALQLRVKKRVEESLERLSIDAHQILCRSSVYRRAVPESFWLAMLGNGFEEQQWSALEALKSHNLVEEEVRGNGSVLLRQHNLIKQVSIELLRAREEEWREVQRVAAWIWLEGYEPEPDIPNIEKVRGKLEAFHHYCEAEEWHSAKEILFDREVGAQLDTWGYYRELLLLHQRLLGKLGGMVDVDCRHEIGFAYWCLGNNLQAMEHYQQSLEKACEIDYRAGEGFALAGLGLCYRSLRNYPKAFECFQQQLTIARELDNRRGEGRSLSNLASIYDEMGNYSQAIEHYQQCLIIARETEDRYSEGIALGNWGMMLLKLEQYSEAQERLQASLDICKSFGFRRGEIHSLYKLGELNRKIGQIKLASDFYNQALFLARELNDPFAKRCENLLATLPIEGDAI